LTLVPTALVRASARIGAFHRLSRPQIDQKYSPIRCESAEWAVEDSPRAQPGHRAAYFAATSARPSWRLRTHACSIITVSIGKRRDTPRARSSFLIPKYVGFTQKVYLKQGHTIRRFGGTKNPRSWGIHAIGPSSCGEVAGTCSTTPESSESRSVWVTVTSDGYARSAR
jgi:hypothetical protein